MKWIHRTCLQNKNRSDYNKKPVCSSGVEIVLNLAAEEFSERILERIFCCRSAASLISVCFCRSRAREDVSLLFVACHCHTMACNYHIAQNWMSARFPTSHVAYNNSNCARVLIGTLSIDNEIHDDDVCNPRRIGSRLSFSAGKTKVKQCVVFRRRRFLVLWQVALAMAFKNVNVLFTDKRTHWPYNEQEYQ